MKIEIRPWQAEDTDTLMEWIEHDPSILASLGMPEDEDLFDVRRRIVFGMQDPSQARFVAFRDGEAIAAMAVYDVRPNGVGFGSIVANPHKKNGFETVAACKQMIGALFNGIGMKEIHVVVSEDNAAALKLAKLVDFEDLGVRQLRLRKETSDGPGNGSGDR